MSAHEAASDVDEPISGAADFVEQHDGEDDARVAEGLAAHMATVGLEAPASRGMVGDVYRDIVQRIRGRRLVEDLGEHEFSLEWLAFHVPRGAKGQLKISSSETLGSGVKLEVLGLSGGSGRRRTFTINEDFREREQCLALSRRVRARLRAFADRGKTIATHVQVDVLAVLAEERHARNPCPECQTDEESDELEQIESALDLRGDSVGQAYKTVMKLESDSSTDLGIPISIPGLKLKPSISLKRSIQLECEMKYELPGGFCYTPFQRTDGWVGLPIWRRT